MRSWILWKSLLIVLSVCILSLYLMAFYFNLKIYDIVILRRFIDEDYRLVNGTKRILFWNTMFGNETFYMGAGDIFRDCPVNDCYATHARYSMDLMEFDAILFHGIELDRQDLPTRRSQRQWYVFVNLESPANRPLVNPYYEDYFNLTMTYRLDSDLVWSYGRIRDTVTDELVAPFRNTSWSSFYNRTGDRKSEEKDALSAVLEGKKLPVIWFVSNCHAASGRQDYVTELSRHITVDVYGKCGNMVCPRTVDCFTAVAEPDYFFYLSFENSMCEDYVTEKLYNALRYNVVPIVYGGADYKIFAPPGSYIDALDFKTPAGLAGYLKWLMQNPKAYKKYFEWKKYYRIETSVHHTVCNMCKFLHETKPSRTYNALSDWYSNGKCPLHRFITEGNTYITGAMAKGQN